MCHLKLIVIVAFSFLCSSSNSLGLSSLTSGGQKLLSSNGVADTVKTVGDVSSVASNVACEKNPSHLLCRTSVKYGHKIEQNLPSALLYRHCSALLATPHCCAQFCKPAAGGSCNMASGACFCDPKSAGRPNVCGLLIGDDSPLGEMNANDKEMLDICREKCWTNTNGCQKAAAATDGIAGTVCVCYCSDSTISTSDSSNITFTPQLPSL